MENPGNVFSLYSIPANECISIYQSVFFIVVYVKT